MMSKLESEVKRWVREVNLKNVENYLAVIKENKLTYLITQGFPSHVTLKSYIQKNKNIGLKKKQIILKLVAKVMSQMINQKEKTHHGHLHTGNILVRSSDRSSRRKAPIFTL